MSGPSVCEATGASGRPAISPTPRPASSTGHVTCHVCPDAEDDLVLVGGLTVGRAVNRAATAGLHETDAANVRQATRDDAARQFSTKCTLSCFSSAMTCGLNRRMVTSHRETELTSPSLNYEI